MSHREDQAPPQVNDQEVDQDNDQGDDFWPEICPSKCIEQLENFFGDDDLVMNPIQEGMSRGHVFSVESDKGSYILKLQAHARENEFYHELGMRFGELGLGLPVIQLNDHQEGMYWLLMEWVPLLLIDNEGDGWDEECVQYLHKVHGIDPNVNFELGTPLWRDKDTARAVELLGGGSELEFTLQELQKDSQHLFEPVGLITGDSALPNWARREDGTLVKFDWRTVGRGHPALDLGILIGLCPPLEKCEEMARMYPGEVTAADIRRGSVWHVVSFLSGAKRGIVNPPEDIFEELKSVFLPWVLSFR